MNVTFVSFCHILKLFLFQKSQSFDMKTFEETLVIERLIERYRRIVLMSGFSSVKWMNVFDSP